VKYRYRRDSPSQLWGHSHRSKIRPKNASTNVVDDLDVQIVDAASRIETALSKTELAGTSARLNVLNPCRTNQEKQLLAIRLYVCALTLGFLVLATMNRGIGILEGVVITCAIVYTILDARADLKERQADLRQLEQLEQHLAVLLSD
jgi:hypothetical protein